MQVPKWFIAVVGGAGTLLGLVIGAATVSWKASAVVAEPQAVDVEVPPVTPKDGGGQGFAWDQPRAGSNAPDAVADARRKSLRFIVESPVLARWRRQKTAEGGVLDLVGKPPRQPLLYTASSVRLGT